MKPKKVFLLFFFNAYAHGAVAPKEPASSPCERCAALSILADFYMDGAFAEEISKKAEQFSTGQLALACIASQDWQYVIIAHAQPLQDGSFLIHQCDSHKNTILHISQIHALRNYWQWTSQPYSPKEYMKRTWQEFRAHHLYENKNAFYQISMLPLDSIIHAIGDLHGFGKCLIKLLSILHWKNIMDNDGILKSNHYLVFLGDISDRGSDSTHVWHKLMMLKILNPNNVFFIRGNHETIQLARDSFFAEWYNHFDYAKSPGSLQEPLEQLFESLPQAVLLGVPVTPHDSIIEQYKFLLFCHGGIDPLVSFNRALHNVIATYKKTGLFETKEFPLQHETPILSGLLWSDFHANATYDEEAHSYLSERTSGLRTYNTSAAREYLEQHSSTHPEHFYNCELMVRGHQHKRDGTNRLLSVKRELQDWEPLPPDTPYANYGPNVYTCTASSRLGGADKDQSSMLTIQYSKQGFWKLESTLQD